jgi:exodeoxyribonuclease VII small subunit
MIMEQKFDYSKAIEELEAIAAKVEDPNTVIEDIDKYIKRSEELISACRDYLRGVREKVDAMNGNL